MNAYLASGLRLRLRLKMPALFAVLAAFFGPGLLFAVQADCPKFKNICGARAEGDPTIVQIGEFWKSERRQIWDRARSLKSPSAREGELQKYRQACQNPEARAHEERQILREVQGALFKIKNSSQFGEFLAEQYQKGFRGFLHWNSANTTAGPGLLLSFAPPMLPNKAVFLREEIREDYEDVIKTFFTQIGSSSPELRAKAVIDFEVRMVQGSASKNKDNAPIPLKELNKKYPHLALLKYWGTELSEVPVFVEGEDKIAALNQYFGKAARETLLNLYLFYGLSPDFEEAYTDFFDEYKEFWTSYFGVDRKESKQSCLDRGFELLQNELSHLAYLGWKPKSHKLPEFEQWMSESLAWIAEQQKRGFSNGEKFNQALSEIKKYRIESTDLDKSEAWGIREGPKFSNSTPLKNQREAERISRRQMASEIRPNSLRRPSKLAPFIDSERRVISVPPTLFIFRSQNYLGVKAWVQKLVWAQFLTLSGAEPKQLSLEWIRERSGPQSLQAYMRLWCGQESKTDSSGMEFEQIEKIACARPEGT